MKENSVTAGAATAVGVPTAELNNNGPAKHTGSLGSLYYPRLQTNGREIILALSRSENGLTTGILVGLIDGKTSFRSPQLPQGPPLGKKFDDWEVGGELTDYDGEIAVVLSNKVKNAEVS